MKNNCILIGYMGCGKSTVGRQLSDILKHGFVDTDALIEEEQGRTISEIFKVDGEQFFRDLETEALRKLLETEGKYVISVGGGLPLREENRMLLQKLGQVIYLKATPDTIYNRIKGDVTRPLLQTKNPKERIIEMLNEREEKYLVAAHKIVFVDEKEISEIVDEIMEIRKALD